VVASSVAGTSATEKRSRRISATVKLTPSTVTDDFATSDSTKRSGGRIQMRRPIGSSSMRRNPADRVDVALDQMALDRVAGADRQLDVEPRARPELAQGRAVRGLARHVDRQRPSRTVRAERHTPASATEPPTVSRSHARGARIASPCSSLLVTSPISSMKPRYM